LYGYVGNHPTIRTDPGGLDWRTGWEGTKGFLLGAGQGILNTVNGLQDMAIGVLNLPAAGINGIAYLQEKVGILNPDDPLRVPYIPSPDWSRDKITHESGEPGSWSDTHGWSKFAGATGVTAFVSYLRAAKAARAGSTAPNATTSPESIRIETIEIPAELLEPRGPVIPRGYPGWLRPPLRPDPPSGPWHVPPGAGSG